MFGLRCDRNFLNNAIGHLTEYGCSMIRAVLTIEYFGWRLVTLLFLFCFIVSKDHILMTLCICFDNKQIFFQFSQDLHDFIYLYKMQCPSRLYELMSLDQGSCIQKYTFCQDPVLRPISCCMFCLHLHPLQLADSLFNTLLAFWNS